MKTQRLAISSLATLALIASVAWIASCGGDKATNPPGGGNPPPGGTSFNSGTMASGSTFSFIFNTAAGTTVNYRCTIHCPSNTGNMAGTVTVSAGGPATAAVTVGPGNAFSPVNATVGVGGTVTWTSAGGSHTVTSP